MLTNLVKLLRVAVVVAFSLVAPTMAEARAGSTDRTAVATSETDREPKGDPNAGLLWIGGAILALIFLAWLAMRVGDVQHPSDKIPN